MNPLRGEGMYSRKQRLAKIKKGPGVFVYDGSHYDHEWKPTPKLTGKKEIVLDSEGVPVVDGSGRPTYKPAGQVSYDDAGKVIMGGKPKAVVTPFETKVIRGVSFPKGKEVVVEDHSLALKLRCMGGFDEVDGAAIEVVADDEKTLGQMTKAELEAKAAELSVVVPNGSNKADIKKLIEEAQTATEG